MDSILIVDDNRQILEHLKEILTSSGYQVSFIPRSDFLLERLENEHFDMLLLDINLPGKNGIEWLEEIKSHPEHQDLPVIMITSEDEKRTLEKCFELGANDYIQKPINEIALKSRIRSAINSKKYIEQQIDLERKKAMQLKMKMLSAQMNPHFIFNSLGSVQSFLMTNDNDKAVDYVSEFAGLMRRNLENSYSDYISIQDEIEFLEKYLQLEKTRFNNSFDFQIENNISNVYDTLIPPMFLQPFIENAVIHGLSKLEGRKGTLTVRIEEKNNSIICVIIDNGIGRVKAKKAKGSSHKSLALSNLEARLELLNSNTNKDEFNFEITDVVNDLNEPIGTHVIVTFPNDLH